MDDSGLAAFFASGRVADIAAAILVLEVAALLVFAKALDRRSVLFNALSGLGLLLALRAALTGGPWWLVAIFMVWGLAAHLADLATRLGSGRRG